MLNKPRRLGTPLLLLFLQAGRPSPMIRVLIVDDHQFFRQCLADLINADESLEVVGECADGSEVASAVRELAPDVVVMDLAMDGMSGLEATAALQRTRSAARVLMLTADAAETSRAAAHAHGAAGYLLKGCAPDVVVHAVRGVAAGRTVWSPESDPALHLT
jgi:DNA-binding NarL/FixJ family response regulator